MTLLGSVGAEGKEVRRGAHTRARSCAHSNPRPHQGKGRAVSDDSGSQGPLAACAHVRARARAGQNVQVHVSVGIKREKT